MQRTLNQLADDADTLRDHLNGAVVSARMQGDATQWPATLTLAAVVRKAHSMAAALALQLRELASLPPPVGIGSPVAPPVGNAPATGA